MVKENDDWSGSNSALEFLMTYGWALLVVLIMIGSLAYFGILEPGRLLPDDKLTPQYICKNLDNGTSVFPEVIIQRGIVSNDLIMNIDNIYGDTGEARRWDNEGVMCYLKAEACQRQYSFCLDVTMVVPVNYTEWKEWRGTEDEIIWQEEE